MPITSDITSGAACQRDEEQHNIASQRGKLSFVGSNTVGIEAWIKMAVCTIEKEEKGYEDP